MSKWSALTLMLLMAGSLRAQSEFPPEFGAVPIPYGAHPVPQAPSDDPQSCIPRPGKSPDLPDDVPNAETPPLPSCQECQECYFGVEYLHWWLMNDKLQQAPITTSTIPSLATSFGALNQGGTQPLFGGSGLHSHALDGVRATLGVAAEGCIPIEIRGFWTQTARTQAILTDDTGGTPLVARPIIASQFGQPEVFLASFPNLGTGGVRIDSETRYWSGELNFLTQQLIGDDDMPGYVIDFHVGGRYMNLDERLDITNRVIATSPALPAFFGGAAIPLRSSTVVHDNFRTWNRFAGGQFGARFDMSLWRFILGLRGNVAMGINHETVDIYGRSELWVRNGSVTSLPGGIQAVPSNAGHFDRDAFVVIPELGATLEFPFFGWMRFYAGYDVAYWSQVVRPGTQISGTIDTRQVPTSVNFVPGFTASNPAPQVFTTDFWVHGFNLGLALTF